MTLSPQQEELYLRALNTETALSDDLRAQLAAVPQKDLISIVTPTHNRAYVLSYCIQSVLAQTYKNFELIIVDDASTDNTRQLVASFQANDPRILYVYKPKTNVSDTRNVGLRLARGRYVAFLDSDSVWDRNFLSMMTHALSATPGHEKVAYCDASLFEKGVARGSLSTGWNAMVFRAKPFIDLCTVLVELNAVREVGLFDGRMTKWVDYELLLRLNNRYGDFRHVPHSLLFYFRLADGLTLASEAQVPMRANMDIIWKTKLAGLRLAYVLNDFPALTQTFVIKEIAHLRLWGLDVMVFHRIHPDRSTEIPADLPVYQFKTGTDLIRLLVDHHRNYMHAHFAYPVPTEFMLPAAEATQCPFTFMPHAVDIFLKLNAGRNRLALVANSPFCRGIFAEGAYHRQFFIDQGVAARNILILRPYCDEQKFWQDELRPLHQVRNLVVIARFQEKKGLPFLIQAFRDLRRTESTLRVYGYGSDAQTSELQALAAGDSRIQILPGVSTEEEVAVLKTADLFVLPSIETKDGDKDGLPTVLREAMAAGVPVLTTPISSIPDLVRHGVTGFLAAPGNVKSLSQQMEEIMDLPSTQLLSIRKAAQERIRTGFGKELTIHTLLEVWKKG
jgi:glycosyltransferase involved in cell wall biosynthesis